MIDEAVIQEAARRLKAAAPPGSEVILFGSYAHGDAHADSDLDFLVVEPHVGDRARESWRLRQELRGIPASFDIIVTPRDRFERWRQSPNHVYHDAFTRGWPVR